MTKRNKVGTVITDTKGKSMNHRPTAKAFIEALAFLNLQVNSAVSLPWL